MVRYRQTFSSTGVLSEQVDELVSREDLWWCLSWCSDDGATVGLELLEELSEQTVELVSSEDLW
jgi:hypothetical protein